MAGEFRRLWDGDEWQRFALQIVQRRHGAHNVQAVPDRVRGDAGIEFYSLDGCAYQCYAPQSDSDTAKAAGAMKQKAGRDLPKLKAYESELDKILGSVRVGRWILLCPFLDDKQVVAYVRDAGERLKQQGTVVLGPNFEALVHSQEDFQPEIASLDRVPMLLPAPASAAAVEVGGELEERLLQKLARAFPGVGPADLDRRRRNFLSAYTERENLLTDLRVKHPQLWELADAGIRSEERRLELVGAHGDQPAEMLQASLDRITETLGRDLNEVARSSVSAISQGTLSDWLMRCPLDFPKEPGK